MKYEITPKRLRTAKPQEAYTLTIFVKVANTEDDECCEARLQYPVESFQHGEDKYLELQRLQKALKEQAPSSAFVTSRHRRRPDRSPSSNKNMQQANRILATA